MISYEESRTMELDKELEFIDDHDYISDVCEHIKQLDIKDFDIENFSSYIEEMPDGYFENIWAKYLVPTFAYVEENWFYLDTEKFPFIDSIETKRKITDEIVKFLMSIFPYDILDKYVIPSKLTTVNEISDWLDEHESDLKSIIAEAIENNQERLFKAFAMIKDIIEDIQKENKKEKYRNRLNAIEKNVEKRIKYMQYFIFCVNETPLDMLKTTIVHYMVQVREI